MPLVLTREGMRAILPRASEAIIVAFVKDQAVLAKAGLLETRPRFAFAMANVEHECSGYTIPNLTESVAYTPARATQVWPSRFKTVSDVYRVVGSSAGDPPVVFRRKLMNSVYGGRMGNAPPPSDDGFNHIGRGGPQITGLDGYREMKRRTGIDFVSHPEWAGLPEYQPAILAAFWSWKNFAKYVDKGDFVGGVRAWNGGTIGLEDRRAKLVGNASAIASMDLESALQKATIERIEAKEAIMPAVKEMPGGPSTTKPPKAVLDDATSSERKARTAGIGAAGAGTGTEVAQTGSKQPEPLISPLITYTFIGVGVAVVIIAAVLITRKHAAVARNWF